HTDGPRYRRREEQLQGRGLGKKCGRIHTVYNRLLSAGGAWSDARGLSRRRASGPKKRPVIANTITERTRHLIRLIQGDEASPLAYCDTQPSDEILLFFAPAQRGRVQGTGPIVAEIKEKSSAPRGGKIWRFGLWCVIV